MTGAPILVGAAIRERGGRRFGFELAAVEPRPDAPDPSAEVRRLTGEIARILEGWIRAHPRQWRWIHWRWRDRPGGSSETYGPADLDAAFGVDAAWGERIDAR
jgi:lauroyl/myristoyl acyltransferase